MIDNNLALLILSGERYDEARDLLGEAIRLRERLVRSHGDDQTNRVGLAQVLNNLGKLEQDADRQADAAKAYRASLAAFAELPASLAARADCRRDRAGAESNLGSSLHSLRQPGESEKAYRRAVAGFDGLTADFPFELEYRLNAAYTRKQLGYQLQFLGRKKEAEDVFREAIRLSERLALDEPESREFRKEWLGDLSALDAFLRGENRTDEVAEVWRQVVKEAREVARRRQDSHGPRLLAGVLQEAALGRLRSGDPAEALPLVEEAVQQVRRAMELQPADLSDSFRLASYCFLLADAQVGRRHYAEAMTAVDVARAATANATLPPDIHASWADSMSARIFASLTGAAQEDTGLEEKQRREVVETAGARAVLMLRDAVKKGYPRTKELGQNPALAPLRKRTDFQELLREIEKEPRK
jgi:tetratricopeptide (TPR) repeat protein